MIDDAALATAIQKMRKLRLIDHIPIKDSPPPAVTFLAVMKQGLGGCYEDGALEYIFRHFLKYYEAAASVSRPEPAATAVRDATEAMALAGARSIGNTIHTDNHMVRARECWRAMWDARDGIVEPIPQGTLVSRPMQRVPE